MKYSAQHVYKSIQNIILSTHNYKSYLLAVIIVMVIWKWFENGVTLSHCIHQKHIDNHGT